MNENLAIQSIRQQDPRGLEDLMDRYGLMVLRIVRQVLGTVKPGDEEECANDIWMTIWQKAIYYDPDKSSFKTWICMITRSKAIDHLRKKYHQEGNTYSLEDERTADLQAEMMDLPEMIEDREDIEQRSFLLNKALAAMPADERHILIRRYFYFEEIPDIAKTFGISRAAMDNRLSRCRKQLREIYLEAEKHEISG